MHFYSYKGSRVRSALEPRFLSPRSGQSELWKVLRADGEGNHPLPPLQTLRCVSDLSFLFLKVSDHYANLYCKWTLPFPWSQDMKLGLIWKATWTQIRKGKVQGHIPVTHSKGLLCSQAGPVYRIYHNHKTSVLFRLRKKSNSRGLRWLVDTRKAQNPFSPLSSYVILPTKNGTCHLPLQGLGHKPLQLLTFNIPWREFRVQIRNEALVWEKCSLLWGKLADHAFRELDIFRRRFYQLKSYICSYPEKP